METDGGKVVGGRIDRRAAFFIVRKGREWGETPVCGQTGARPLHGQDRSGRGWRVQEVMLKEVPSRAGWSDGRVAESGRSSRVSSSGDIAVRDAPAEVALTRVAGIGGGGRASGGRV